MAGTWQMRHTVKRIDAKHYLLEVDLRREKVASFSEYPFCLPAVKHLHTLRMHPAVTFIVGENGTGKSTLLEAIAVAWGFNPEGGSKNFAFTSRASHSELHKFLTLVRGLTRPRDGYSPIIMAYPDAQIFLLTEKGLKPKAYTETEHYSVAKAFLNNHRKMLDILLSD